MVWWIVGSAAVVLMVAVWVVATYNRLVGRRNKVEEAWSGIDVQLQRRADLVPNLVETVKGYASHEEGVFTAVAEARARLAAATGPEEAGAADQALTGALRQLFAVAEAYPQLQASQNFLQLQRDLGAVEEELAFARRYYNAVVEDLNTDVQSFPTLLVAGPLGFRRAAFFEAEAESRAVPTTGFGT